MNSTPYSWIEHSISTKSYLEKSNSLHLNYQSNILITCFEVFNDIIDRINSDFKQEVVLELQVELLESKLLKTDLNKLFDFELEIDTESVPELFFSYPQKVYLQPQLEYYYRPIQLLKNVHNCCCYYSAYKRKDEIMYNRWITISKLL